MPRPRNAFLRSLPAKTYDVLERRLTAVELAPAASLRRSGEPADWVHFPEAMLGSVLAVSDDGDTVETSMVGNEGADGILEVCGSGISSADVKVQVAGGAWRVPGSVARDLVDSDSDFRRRVWMLVEFQITEARQSALCNAIHMVEARFARWLLESYDRSGEKNALVMTQEFIGAMLGVQRSTVSAFAGQLQKTGLIEYSRGLIELRDLVGLEMRACECRPATRAQRERLGLMLGAD